MTTPSFSLRQLRYFLAVAESGRISDAAARINVSEAALSSAVTGLEAELGVQLLVRRKAHGVTLTQAGRDLVGEARDVLVSAEAFQERARGAGRTLSGTVEIGIYAPLAPFLLPAILEGFVARHPAVRVNVKEGSLTELQTALRLGRCEMAILYDVGLAPDIAGDRLYDIHPSLVLGAGHRLASRRRVTLADLAEEPIVLFDMPPAREKVEEILRESRVLPRIAFASANFELVRALVARGPGYTILYHLPAAGLSYDGHKLVAFPIRKPFAAATVVLAQTRQIRATSRAVALKAFCLETVRAPAISL